ncbi:hypothetical protein Herbaro_09250 [Herbaspirillum sp. WKF16]|uniref:hypothetical protein n=1 Tax=Herbaspirillum sp. WKF16 TaxID=3028312 RepID=UPI0023A9A661|nr:hypothetical protein [Herbaspirillum sp. WKF16]WDZ97946.1 hypothetical protein Herbaro_09250 [Herbaspirillum sp. WKF16]
MATDKTGGPAFPGVNPVMTGIDSDGAERFENEASGGMTLRDYFAAHAPIDLAWANEIFFRRMGRNAGWLETLEQLAELRGAYADRMIQERAK